MKPQPTASTGSPPDRSDVAAQQRAEAEAAAWIARRDAGLSADERTAFAQWLAADPRHAEAWHELHAAWEAFDLPRRTGVADAMLHELAARRRRRRWHTGWAVATAAAAAVAIGLLLPRRASPEATTHLATNAVLVAPQERALPDTSIVKLSPRTTLDVDFLPHERRVVLLTGEAQFAVAKNPERPFIVTAGGVKIRAVGTEFSVTVGADAVELLVTEGTVAVERPVPAPDDSAAGGTDPVLVSAGGLLKIPIAADDAAAAFDVQTLSATEIERRLEWLAPRLELSGTPLAEVVALFNRHAGARLTIADAALADLRMSGVFRADNVEGFLRLLELGYDVKVERTDAGSVVLRAAP